MDEVLKKLGTTFIDTNGDENNKTNFDGLYKNWGKLGNQEQRRKELLDTQRWNRSNNLDRVRGIIDYAVEENDVSNNEKKSTYRPNIFVAGFTKAAPNYKNVLMLSEWMIEKPAEFHEKWMVVPCPKGVRTLVVASQGITKCYSKYGHFRLECRTALPGGSSSPAGNNTRCCVLDCFHVEATKTMYVLDLLAWNNLPMTDGETEFRHYWLQTQLAEIPEVDVLSKDNKLIFKILPKVHCREDTFNEFMMKLPHFEQFSPGLDGLLFYHKRAHYFAGQTPLVGWLYPFMVPEVIGPDVTVNPGYLLDKPPGYVNQADFILDFEQKTAKKNEKKKRVIPMDTTPPKGPPVKLITIIMDDEIPPMLQHQMSEELTEPYREEQTSRTRSEGRTERME